MKADHTWYTKIKMTGERNFRSPKIVRGDRRVEGTEFVELVNIIDMIE